MINIVPAPPTDPPKALDGFRRWWIRYCKERRRAVFIEWDTVNTREGDLMVRVFEASFFVKACLDLQLLPDTGSKKTWYSVPRDVDAESDVYGSSSSKSIPLPSN
ncbi:hypothetical protein Tco_1005537 [Tanacetum coccineum]|uniref:Uncharacterized protein n=1 Tax=Tanacetum coccineum TaxID=301880 RepID=A0ABQ5FG24_9ASTR